MSDTKWVNLKMKKKDGGNVVYFTGFLNAGDVTGTATSKKGTEYDVYERTYIVTVDFAKDLDTCKVSLWNPDKDKNFRYKLQKKKGTKYGLAKPAKFEGQDVWMNLSKNEKKTEDWHADLKMAVSPADGDYESNGGIEGGAMPDFLEDVDADLPF